MSTRGRPKNTEPSLRFAIVGRLHQEHDADIIAWLNAIPKGQRMNALKIALRNGGLELASSPENGDQDEVQGAANDILSNWEF